MIENINYTIQKKEKGYLARITYYENGVRRFKQNGHYELRKDCVESTDLIIQQLENNVSGALPFDKIAEEYLTWYKARRKASSFRTIDNLARSQVIPYFKGQDMHKIKPKDILKFQNDKMKHDYSGRYLREMHNVLVSIFKYAERIHELKSNPATIVGNVDVPINKRDNYWTVDEFKTFIDGVKDQRRFTLFYLMFYTGIRKGEARALIWNDYDPIKKIVRVNKTNYLGKITMPKTKAGHREVALPDHLCKVLDEYKHWYKINQVYRDDFVMFGKLVKAYNESTIDGWFREELKRSGAKKIVIHELRHSHASDLINRLNASPFEVAKRLGHSDVHEVFNRYGHLYPNQEHDLIKDL